MAPEFFFVFFVFFVVQSLLSVSGQPDLAIDNLYRDPRKCISSRRASEAAPRFDIEAGAVRCANDLAGFEQEPARRPVQAAAGMRTFVEISEHVRALAQQDHRKYSVVELGIDSGRSAVGNGLELA